MPIRFEYRAQVINGNFFDVARAMNDDLSFQGWELVAIETVNQFHCVAMLKKACYNRTVPKHNGGSKWLITQRHFSLAMLSLK